MRFVVSGGGTGGHIYPALAIADGLRERYPNCQIMYIGTAKGLEADIVPKAGLDFHVVRAVGFKRSLTLYNLKVPWEAWFGYRQARHLIRDFNPQAVIGTGGYVCGPVVMAAARMKIPTLIHEQNALPGITNRILSRITDRVAVTFEDALTYFPRRAEVRLTGLPVRAEIHSADRRKAREKFGVQKNELLVLSFGGSQGARSLNKAVAEAFDSLTRMTGLRLLHVTGREQHAEFINMLKNRNFTPDTYQNAKIVPYLYDMPEAMAAADLVISRAGAATLAEITVRGLPAILVPFPFATSNHQEHNARALVSRKAGQMIRDADFSGAVLVEKVDNLLTDFSSLNAMAAASKQVGKPRALDDIIENIVELIS